MRLFIAVAPGPGVVSKLREMLERLRGTYPEPRWVEAGQAHLTLAFLGEVAQDRLEPVRQSMAAAVKDRAPFPMAFGSSGAFPGWSSPRVLWLGLESGGDHLCGLEAALRAQLVSRGFRIETRDYHPHLTLCRFPDTFHGMEGLRAEVERSARAQSWKDCATLVDGVELVSSKLTPQGPVYSVLHVQKF